HNLLMIGPPGSGKSMLAARLPGLLPPLDAREALEVSMVASLAGELRGTLAGRERPYRDPHHSASMAAIVGGGTRAKPGEVSLAHHGVLFLDELPEFQRPVLEALRQPLESGETVVARANAHVRYPSQVQLVGAMNPCRCGYMDDPAQACSRAPKCGVDYQTKLSGPLLDRIDLTIEVPPVMPDDLLTPPSKEGTQEVRERVRAARERQRSRFLEADQTSEFRVNAEARGAVLDTIAPLDEACRGFLSDAARSLALTARGFHRVVRVARTIADLAGERAIARPHLAEALSYRRPTMASFKQN
ncbi:MAG: ATP-binding protein, partial [Pseudomonadota bacterium]